MENLKKNWPMNQMKILFQEVGKNVQELHPDPNIPEEEQLNKCSIAWNEVVKMVNEAGEPGAKPWDIDDIKRKKKQVVCNYNAKLKELKKIKKKKGGNKVKLYEDDELNKLIADVASQINAAYDSYKKSHQDKIAMLEEAMKKVEQSSLTFFHVKMYANLQMNRVITKVLAYEITFKSRVKDSFSRAPSSKQLALEGPIDI